MTYEVSYSRTAEKQLARITRADRRLATAIADAVDALGADPRPPGCRELEGRPGLWRIKVRQVWRALYTIDDQGHAVVVALVAHRSQVYQQVRRR